MRLGTNWARPKFQRHKTHKNGVVEAGDTSITHTRIHEEAAPQALSRKIGAVQKKSSLVIKIARFLEIFGIFRYLTTIIVKFFFRYPLRSQSRSNHVISGVFAICRHIFVIWKLCFNFPALRPQSQSIWDTPFSCAHLKFFCKSQLWKSCVNIYVGAIDKPCLLRLYFRNAVNKNRPNWSSSRKSSSQSVEEKSKFQKKKQISLNPDWIQNLSVCQLFS